MEFLDRFTLAMWLPFALTAAAPLGLLMSLTPTVCPRSRKKLFPVLGAFAFLFGGTIALGVGMVVAFATGWPIAPTVLISYYLTLAALSLSVSG